MAYLSQNTNQKVCPGRLLGAMKWLKNYEAIVFLGLLISFNIFNVVSKEYEFGQRFFPVLALSFSTPVICCALYKKMRERALIESILLFTFLALYALASLFSQTKNFGLSQLLAVSSTILLYLTLAYGYTRWDDARKQSATFIRTILRNIITTGAVISTLLGYYFFFTRPATRFSGAFLNIDSIADNWPNAFALFALMVWPLLASRIVERASMEKHSRLSYLVQTAALIILFSGFLLTFSRAAYLVLILQLIFLACIFFTKIGAKILLLPKGASYIPIKSPRLKKILFHAVFIAAIAMSLAFSAQWIRHEFLSSINVAERLTFQTPEKNTSISERMEFWTGGLKLAWEKPILGFGPSSFRFVYPRVQKTLLASADHPHNMIVKIAEEAGFPTAIIFIIFLVVTLTVIGKRIRFLEHEKKMVAIFFLVAILGAVLHNLVDYNFNFLENLLIFWVILALLRSTTAFPHLSKPRTLPAVLILALLFAGLSIFEARLLLFKKEGLAKEAIGAFTEGEKYLEAYEYTNFPRNYFIKRADTFRREGNFDLAETALKKQLDLNAYDSEAWHRLGEIQRKQKRFHEAFESFKKALSLNPKNHFWYWWNFFDIAEKLGRREEIEERMPELLTLLSTYENQLKINLHFTRETPNADAAIALWKFLAKFYPEKSAIFLKKATEFEALQR